MIFFLTLLFSFSQANEFLPNRDLQLKKRAEAIFSENSSSGLRSTTRKLAIRERNSWLCQFQLHKGGFPGACYTFLEDLSASKKANLGDFLDEKCLDSLKVVKSLKDLPQIPRGLQKSSRCRLAIESLKSKLQYVGSESEPWEVLKSISSN